MDSKGRSTNDLIQAVGSWADRNFEYRGAHWGILEEVGEAAHCILKHAQKIRDYQDVTFFRKQLMDCFADVMIYLADYSYLHRAFFAFKRNQIIYEVPILSEEKIVSDVLSTVMSIMAYASVEAESVVEVVAGSVYNVLCQRLCTQMERWAQYHSYDLEQITWETWDSNVSKRDWKKNAKAG